MSTSAKTDTGVSRVVTCPNCNTKNRVPPAADGVPRCGNCQSPLPWVVDAGESDFADVADQATIPVLVDIWAPWCGPCRMVSPVLEQLATEYAGRLKLVKVNADEAPSLSSRFDVQAIPTLVLLDRGKVLDRQVGAAPATTLRSWIQNALEKKEG
jgi:thioredoxin 2